MNESFLMVARPGMPRRDVQEFRGEYLALAYRLVAVVFHVLAERLELGFLE